ncbi:MAG: trypsin-like peptidase domain-containing protein [Deltaproteobacteria bacterium]|nr:trypsin-like peptidase domain-containing protein [Deltaproteobacteria bacterium]
MTTSSARRSCASGGFDGGELAGALRREAHHRDLIVSALSGLDLTHGPVGSEAGLFDCHFRKMARGDRDRGVARAFVVSLALGACRPASGGTCATPAQGVLTRPCSCKPPVDFEQSSSVRAQVDSLVRRVAPSLVQLSAPMPERSRHAPLRVVAGSPFAVTRAGPLGTGVLVAPRLVLTALHVVEHTTAVRARHPNGREVSATLVARTPEDDLALLRLTEDESGDAPPVPVAAPGPAAGEWVITLGELHARGPTVTVGMVTTGRDASEDEAPPHSRSTRW